MAAAANAAGEAADKVDLSDYSMWTTWRFGFIHGTWPKKDKQATANADFEPEIEKVVPKKPWGDFKEPVTPKGGATGPSFIRRRPVSDVQEMLNIFKNSVFLEQVEAGQHDWNAFTAVVVRAAKAAKLTKHESKNVNVLVYTLSNSYRLCICQPEADGRPVPAVVAYVFDSEHKPRDEEYSLVWVEARRQNFKFQSPHLPNAE